MNYFRCSVIGGGSGGGSLIVTCDSQFAGLTISCTKGTTVYRKTCPSTSPYQVTFSGLESGTWTISATINGETYSTTVTIEDVEASLTYGFDWKSWVRAGGLNPDDYNDLDEVLENEVALRRLFIVHASVDFLANSTVGENVTKIINNDLCAKWINLSDYALDKLYANADIKDVMDEADKYGYGEWSLVGQVPIMASNTEPYGEAIASGSSGTNYAPWLAFDGKDSTNWAHTYQSWIGYHFIKPIVVKKFKIKLSHSSKMIVQASNDGSNWTDISSEIPKPSEGEFHTYDLDNNTAYEYYRIYVDDSYTPHVNRLQFYAWAPKGNVPVMTSNTAPYGTAFANSEYSSSYAAYNVFNGDLSKPWVSGEAKATTGSVGYKFTNPIEVRKAYVYNWGNITTYTYTFKVQYSDDNSTWNDISGASKNISQKSGDYIDVPSAGYHLYWRVYLTVSGSASGSDVSKGVAALQFYGRELKVSVPIMNTNTTPYGEVFSSVPYDTTYAAWKAFNPSEAKGWITSSGNLLYIGYKFTSAVQINRIMFKMVSTNQGKTFGSDLIFQGSNDNSIWTDLKTISVNDIALTTNEQYISIPNTNEFLYYRLTGGWNYAGTGTKLQFYGPDYSEKEFEKSTNKKWLYDHGVELEPITLTNAGSNSVGEKRTDSIILQITGGTSSSEIDVSNVNFSKYSLMRAKVGKEISIITNAHTFDLCVLSSVPYNWSSGSNVIAQSSGDVNTPNNCSLGVSSINDTQFASLANTANGNYPKKTEIVEWWLE